MDDNAITTLNRWAKGESPGPYRMDLRPTTRCNLKCKSCTNRATDDKRRDYKEELNPGEILRVIREAADLGVREVELSGGGEPTTNPDAALEYFLEIKRLGMSGEVTTNGTLFTLEKIREMVKSGWDRIMFSVDAPDKATHDMLRGVQGSFERTIRTINGFVSEKRAFGVDKPRIGIGPVLTRFVISRIRDIIKLAHDLGIQEVVFRPMYAHTEEARRLLPSDRDRAYLKRETPRMIEYADKCGIKTNLCEFTDSEDVVEKSAAIVELLNKNFPLQRQADGNVEQAKGEVREKEHQFLSIPCFFPWYYITVSAFGHVTPCVGSDYLGENVRKKSLKQIWRGQFFTSFRERIRTGDLPSCCKKCCVNTYLDNERIRKRLLRGETLV